MRSLVKLSSRFGLFPGRTGTSSCRRLQKEHTSFSLYLHTRTQKNKNTKRALSHMKPVSQRVHYFLLFSRNLTGSLLRAELFFSICTFIYCPLLFLMLQLLLLLVLVGCLVIVCCLPFASNLCFFQKMINCTVIFLISFWVFAILLSLLKYCQHY